MSNIEIPKGYKQTELGIIPNDWDIDELENLTISISSGKSNTKTENGPYPIYGSTGIIGYKLKSNYLGEKILVARVGANAGTVNKVKGEYCVSDNTLIVSLNSMLDFKFTYYKLLNYNLNRLIFGSGQPLITGSQLKSLNFTFPPKPEQEAIANVLSNTDELIQALEKLIEKKKKIKEGTMQQLLTGKKRLEGFNDEWEVKRLGNHAKMFSGGTPSTKISEYYGGKIPWVSITDITLAGKFLSKTEKKITEKGLENSSARLFDKGTLLLAMYASIGKSCIGTIDLKTSQAILGINVDKSLSTEYIFYYFQFNQNYLLSKGQQGTQSNLSKAIVQDLEIKVPSKPEQQAIAQILTDMDSEIKTLNQKLNKYKQIKEGMMQQLLTGKIRLI